MASRVRKGDMVQVIAGKYKGKQGKILDVLVGKDRVRVEGVAMIKRHLKPGRDPKIPQGGIIDRFGTVHISNVMALDPDSKKPTRVGFKTLKDGSKVRFAKRSGEVLAEAKQQ